MAKNARLGAVVTINPHDLSLCLTACRYKAYSPTVACFLSSEQLQFVADMRVRRSLVSEIPSAKVQVAHPSLYQRTELVAGREVKDTLNQWRTGAGSTLIKAGSRLQEL